MSKASARPFASRSARAQVGHEALNSSRGQELRHVGRSSCRRWSLLLTKSQSESPDIRELWQGGSKNFGFISDHSVDMIAATSSANPPCNGIHPLHLHEHPKGTLKRSRDTFRCGHQHIEQGASLKCQFLSTDGHSSYNVRVFLHANSGGPGNLDTGISGFLPGHDRREVHAKAKA